MTLPRSHLHVLLTLATKDRHGYSIMRETEELTDGQVKLGPGALYAALGKLVDGGLVMETEERPAPEFDDARRRYYRITDAGRTALGLELQRLDKVITYARSTDLGWSPT